MPVIRKLLRRLGWGPACIIGLFLLALPAANPRVYATDEVQYYVYLRSLRFDGDLDFANDYRELARRNPQSGIEGSLLQENRIRPRTGLYGNIAPVGCAIMWAPFFLAADALVQLANLSGARIPADGFSKPYILSVCYASSFYGLLGLLLCRRLARRYTSERAATAATVAVWLASPLVFYMFIQMPFAHATGFFLTALFVTIWHESRGREAPIADQAPAASDQESAGVVSRRPPATGHQPPATIPRHWRTWAALGLVGGLMTITREQLGLFLLIPAAEALVDLARGLRRRQWSQLGRLVGGYLCFGGVFALALAPQILAYQALNGEPRPAGEVSGRINWCSPHFADTLIDSDPAPSPWCNTVGDFTAQFPPLSRGAFVWSPILLIGLAGLALLWQRDRGLVLALLLAFLAETYINGAYGTTWHLRGAFGFRRLIECTPIFVLGLALLLDRLAGRAGWGVALVPLAALVLWNTGLVLNATFFEPETSLRRIGLVWPDVWRWQAEAPLKVAQRLGDIVFNRCRFLQNGDC